jgi:hypothetical protein
MPKENVKHKMAKINNKRKTTKQIKRRRRNGFGHTLTKTSKNWRGPLWTGIPKVVKTVVDEYVPDGERRGKSPTAWGNMVRSREFGAGSCAVEILCGDRMFELGRT